MAYILRHLPPLVLLLAACSGRQSSSELICVPAVDWVTDINVSFPSASVAALVREAPRDTYESDEHSWPAFGREPSNAASLELHLQPSEPVALILVPADACPDHDQPCRTWSRDELENAPIGEPLPGGAYLLARVSSGGAQLTLSPPLPGGSLFLVRLTSATQRNDPFRLTGRLHLTWAGGTRTCSYSRTPAPRRFALRAWSSRCGNGLPEVGEPCDDGNLDPNDGCSEWCEVEPATCPAEGPPVSWDVWTCDTSREPTPCSARRCAPDSVDPVCDRRSSLKLSAWVHGRNSAASPVATIRARSIGLECAALDGTSTVTSAEICELEVPPCSRTTLELEVAKGAKRLGWRSRERRVKVGHREFRNEPGCGPRRDACVIPDDAPLDAVAIVESPTSGVRAVHRRNRFGYAAAAPGGGFFLSSSVTKTVPDDQGREVSKHVTSIEHVDVDLRPIWRHELPIGLWVHSLVSDHRGGVVATVLTNDALCHNELEFSERGIGLIAIDSNGRWRFGRRIDHGMQRSPHYLSVEPGQHGRIAVLMRDIIERSTYADGRPHEIWGPKIRIYDFNGRPRNEITRPWNNADGLLWTGPSKLLIFADRGGRVDPERLLLPLPDALPEVPPNQGNPEVMELIDADSGQAYWSREWLSYAGWTARPTLGPDNELAFITIFIHDPRSPDESGRISTQYERLIVMDAHTGQVRWSRLLDNPRSCRGARRVLSDPRNGDWIVLQPRECAGQGQYPTSLLIERSTVDGAPRWTELVGSVAGGAPRNVGRDRDWPRIHAHNAAVAASGHTLITGVAGHITIAGQRFSGNLEHYTMVLEP